METFCDDVDDGATPAKRMKLSPRRSININNESQRLDQFKKRLSCYNSDSLLSTPIVKRRSIRNESINNDQFENSIIETPPSILKVRPFLRNSISPENNLRKTSTTPEIIEDDHSTNTIETKIKKRTSFGISSRKPIPRTPRTAVHFEEFSNSRSSNKSGQNDQSEQLQIQIDVHHEQTSDKSAVIDSKNSTRSTDDVFYSPNSSMNLSDNTSTNQQQSNEDAEETSNPTNESSRISSLKRKANDSVSSRRSYKPSTPVSNIQNTSIRESLRSRRTFANVEPEKYESEPKETNIKIIVTEKSPEKNNITERQSVDNEATKTPQPPSITPTTINTRLKSRQSVTSKTEATPESSSKLEPLKIVPKVSGRRSLSRQVLENNLFSKVVATPSPRMNTRLSVTKLTDSDKKRGVEVSYSKSTTSIVKTMTDDKIEEKCDIKVIEKKDEFSSEKNDDNSAQVIKHVHNEIETKSNVTKVTELLDDVEETTNGHGDTTETSNFEEMNVLSFNSDISESEASHFYNSIPHFEKRYSVLLSTPDSNKNTSKTDKQEPQEEMEVFDDEMEKISDQSDESSSDKIEKNKVEATNSHDDCIKEMKQPQKEMEVLDLEIDEASDEEKMSNQDDDEDEENEINIYDDLVEDIPQENMDYGELNSEESEEEIQEQTIPEEEAQTASSSSEDSSQSSDVILINTSSDYDKSNQSSESSNSSSDKAELLQEKNNDLDLDDEDVEYEENEQPNENVSEDSDDLNRNLEVQTINEYSNESNDNNTSEENFKLTLNESDEEEYLEKEDENKLTLDESVEDEETEKKVENKLTLNESVENKENKLTLDESVKEEEMEKEDKNKHVEIMEDINEDNMDKNNEFFINEDIEEMENVEYITEKSNDSETTKQSSQINTLTEIQELNETIAQSQEKESNISETNSFDNNVIELLESIETQKSEEIEQNQTFNETNKKQTVQIEEINVTDLNQLETNVIEISEITIKSHENIEVEEIQVTVNNPLEQNVIEISESIINYQDTTVQSEEIMDTSSNLLEKNIEITESTIKHQETTVLDEEEMDTSSNPLEQNIMEISESTIRPHENEESSIQIEDVIINPLEQNIIEILSPKQKSPKLNEIQTPARRTRSASQHSETKKTEAPKTPTRSSTRRRSIDHKIEEEPKQKSAQKITKKRTVSVDTDEKPVEENVEQTKTVQTKTMSRRKSIDDTPRKTRASSVINLEIIEEDKPMNRTRRAASVDLKTENEKPHQRRGQSLEPETTTKTTTIIKRGRKRALQSNVIQKELQSISEKIEEYSSTHRLTRHQKSIMEKSLVNQEKSRLQKLKEVEQIDQTNLLDKKSFTGSPDKEEEGTYRALSPASSISTQSSAAFNEHVSPSTPKRKRGRPSLSGTPGSSTNTDCTSIERNRSPGRPRRRSFTQAQQAMAATTPTRSRRSSRTTSHDQDDTASVVSVSSVMSVPVIQLKQLTEKNIVRHRSLSPTALNEETAVAKNRRSKRSSILPTNLSKISEETNVETNEEKPRRGRHRKTDAGGSSSQSELSNRDPGLKKTFRRSSYKPLENYLPEHAVVKTRKTFKIRKFSRGGSSSSP